MILLGLWTFRPRFPLAKNLAFDPLQSDTPSMLYLVGLLLLVAFPLSLNNKDPILL